MSQHVNRISKMNKENTILVVDDQPANVKVLLAFLKTHGFKTNVATSGERALLTFETTLPDIILLDVMMPGIDGFETCRRIKASPKSAEIPVIFMTALDSEHDKMTAFEVGGVDYVTKPFQKGEVLARLNTHLTLQHQKNVLAQQKQELEQALAEVKQLSGILPICACCKKIRDDKGYWQQVEAYISTHSETRFSHGYCPDCFEKEMKEVKQYTKMLKAAEKDS